MIVVTGASGLFGQALTRQLLLDGKPVRILLRDMFSPGFEGLGVEKVQGSVTDLDSLVRAFNGIDVVYHTASMPSNLPGMYDHLYHVNVRGTENVIAACKTCGVRQLVFIASYQALGLPANGEILTESAGFNPEKKQTDYGKTMSIACRAVEQANSGTLATAIILPTYQLGPFDYKLAVLGRFIWDFARSRVPFLIRGGFEIVDTRDVASFALSVSNAGVFGESFLVSSGFIGVDELAHWLEAMSGRDVPSGYLPAWLMYPAALFMEMQYRVYGDQPILNRSTLKIISSRIHVQTAKARSLLGFSTRPWEQTFADTWKWMAEHYHLVRVHQRQDSVLTDRTLK